MFTSMAMVAQSTGSAPLSSGEEAVAMAVVLAIVLVFLAAMIAVQVVICLLLHKTLAAIPVEHRKMNPPGMVWLLFIPFFNLVWNFFVFLQIPDSFKSYFDSIGQSQGEDYGRGLGLTYSILAASSMVLGWVPCLGSIVGIAALVVLIMVLVKFWQFKNLVSSVEAAV